MKAKHLALFSVLLVVALVLAACPAQPVAPAAQPPAAAVNSQQRQA